jgi:putative FmdB family regulatory protein
VLYEYRHNAKRKRGCPKTFELIRNISARDDAAACPKCGSKDTERLKFQAFAIAGDTPADIFAGDGEADDFDDIGDDFGF